MSGNRPGTRSYSMSDADRLRPRKAVCLPKEMWARVAEDAERCNVSISAWMEEAAKMRLAGEVEPVPTEARMGDPGCACSRVSRHPQCVVHGQDALLGLLRGCCAGDTRAALRMMGARGVVASRIREDLGALERAGKIRVVGLDRVEVLAQDQK